jgi:CBS domain-containing protein
MKCHVETFVKPVLTAAPTDTVTAVADLMAEHNVGCVVIVEQHRPVGIVTDRDLALALGVQGAKPHMPIVRLMTTPVETILESDGVFQATHVMRESKVRRLVVVDDEGEVEGIVTMDDLLRLLSRELSNLVEGIAVEMQVH